MKQYVIALATQIPHIDTQSILLVERVKEDWQKGRLNLPGGSIEPGEPPELAAVRELEEETGVRASVADTKVMGMMLCGDCIVHICLCPFRDWFNGGKQVPRQMEDQPVHYLPWRQVMHDPRLIPNLRIIIPLCNSRLTGWTLECDDSVGGDLQWITTLSPVTNAV
jgi:8-oxo-dGTP pyrophosphatase MutT (NUDIX family)